MNDYTIKATTQEAMLCDWVLTLHTYDPDQLSYLLEPEVQRLRYQAGRIILQGKGELALLEDEVKWLLAILPATFRFGNKDVAFSLRKKLHEALLGRKQRVGSFLTGVTGFLRARIPFAHRNRVKTGKYSDLTTTRAGGP